MECIYFILIDYRKEEGDTIWLFTWLLHEGYFVSWHFWFGFVSSYLQCSFLDMYGSTCVKHVLWYWFLSELYCVKVFNFQTLNISEYLIFCRGHDSWGHNSACHSRSWTRAALQNHMRSCYSCTDWWIPNQITELKVSEEPIYYGK